MAPYQAYYCEENVWQLARHRGGEGAVVFISNPSRTVAMWQQQAAPAPEQPIVWDYHVVLMQQIDGRLMVFDRDSKLTCPCSFEQWSTASFPHIVPAEFSPVFRVVSAADYLECFASDRSHMKSDEGWRALPPEWPLIGDGMNLFDYVDVNPNKGPGQVVSLDALATTVLEEMS